MTSHDWRFDKHGKNDSNLIGEWHRCSGCSKRVFFPDGCNDFQKKLTVAVAWILDVGILNEDELNRRTVKNVGKFGMDKGYAGVLSDDCELAQLFTIEFVMSS